MDMYVLQVKPGFEVSAAEAIRKLGYNALCPMKEQPIRRGGSWQLSKSLIFTQYIFVECELTDDTYYRIRSVNGILRFLGFGKPEELPKDEAMYIRILYNDGVPIETSKVYTSAAGAKMVLSGVLRNYVDNIVSLDLRQRRAKVKVELFGKEYKITLPVIAI